MPFPFFVRKRQFDDVVGRSYLERAFAPPKSNYTGQTGIQVDGQLMATQAGFYIPVNAKVVNSPYGSSGGPNTSPDQQPLTNLDEASGSI